MISRALADEELPVYGDGANVRDCLHVSDHCEAIDLILHKGRVGEIYNIGGHNERTNLEVVKTILKALDKPESLIRYVKDRPGHDRRYCLLYTSHPYIEEMTEGCRFRELPDEEVSHLYSFVTCSYEFADARTIVYAVDE